jgi:predicted RNase H-like nuclease (RuvC/YqgF family)
MVDFEEAAAQLYAAPAADFIATRNKLAKELKADGDQLGSTRLKALRKPTVAAWLANLVARQRPDELDDLLALGDEFRQATEDLDGDRLRELTPQRHQLLDKLAQVARSLAEENGQKVSVDVAQKLRETLDAALVDPAAGEAVREGQLSSALRHVGFGVVDESGEPTTVAPLTAERRRRAEERRAKASHPQATEETVKEKAARERAEREQEEREQAQRDQAQRELDQAVAAAEAAEASVEDLDTRLAAAREAVEKAQDEVRRLSGELDEARKTARAAQQKSREARKRRNRL